jgi:hypothetical protein
MRIILLTVAIAAMTSAFAAGSLEAREQLIGTWEPIGENCGGDNHVTYEHDGTYRSYSDSGTWRLSGRKLQTVIFRRGEPGDRMREVQPPEREEAVILSLSDRRMTVRARGGSARRLHRCR